MVQTKVPPPNWGCPPSLSTHSPSGCADENPHPPPALLPQDQFEFALTAVAEEVNAILKALPQ